MMSVGEQFMAHLAKVYQENDIAGPDIDLRTADRMDYLNKLGMAYIDEDISRACVVELSESEAIRTLNYPRRNKPLRARRQSTYQNKNGSQSGAIFV